MKMKHVTISTAKLQESVIFYETFCGLTIQRKIEQPGYNIVFLPTPIFSPNPHVKFFFVEDPSGVEIQFI